MLPKLPGVYRYGREGPGAVASARPGKSEAGVELASTGSTAEPASF